jgi:hypothetical protein
MIRLKSPPVFAVLLYTFFGVVGSACAQEQEPPTAEQILSAETAPLFASHEVLKITLEADFHTIRREDRSEEDSQERPAVMHWTNPDGTVETQDIQVETRGIFRLDKRNCEFPPLRINVKKGQVEGTLFEGQDKLKMVSPCKLGQEYWQQYVLAEYLVYRMFNLLSPMSFRVRLVSATFTDTSGEDDEFTKMGFLIEDDDALATRIGGWKVDWNREAQFHPQMLDKRQAIVVDLFQYLIGNTDWSGIQMHNVELIHQPPQMYATVPYDFDFSGIIDTRYATPDPSLGIRSVRERLFRGMCPEEMNRTQEDYEAVYQEFRDKKEEIYDLWRNLEGMEEDRIDRTLEYLDDFYEILNDPRQVQRRLMDQCRSIYGG